MIDHTSGTPGLHTESRNSEKLLGLWYDPDRLMLEGVYNDEVTAYRARKRWINALERHFLLEDSLDFNLIVNNAQDSSYYKVRCDFLTACGRYAFWRLTHHQAPEVQCLLETAHLPNTPFEGASAPDAFCEIDAETLSSLSNPSNQKSRSDEPSWLEAIRSIQSAAGRLFLKKEWFKK
jgi:hypothetical protein